MNESNQIALYSKRLSISKYFFITFKLIINKLWTIYALQKLLRQFPERVQETISLLYLFTLIQSFLAISTSVGPTNDFKLAIVN